MTLNDQKEKFSIAYASAIAATAGISISIPQVDDDSIDLTFHQKATFARFRSPKLDVQAKCSDVSTLTISDGLIHFPLKLKNYNELRDETVLVPRILLVVLVPNTLDDWAAWTPQQLTLKQAGYWMSLRGFPATTNDTSVVTHVPMTNEFSVAQLRAIMQRVGEGGNP